MRLRTAPSIDGRVSGLRFGDGSLGGRVSGLRFGDGSLGGGRFLCYNGGTAEGGGNVNDRQLEWFCRAYEARSFSKAAEKAFVSRQALGKAVRSLELELGTALFVRSESGLAPTSAADLVYPMARRCVEGLLEIKGACADFAADTRRIVRIAIADGVVDSLSDDFFDRLEAWIPSVEFVIEKHFLSDCVRLLDEEAVDFALCPVSANALGFERIPLAREPVFVAVSQDVLGMSAESCTFQDLSGLTFFAIAGDDSNDLGLSEAFAARGFTLDVNRNYSEYDIILRKVRAGHGAVLVPKGIIGKVACDQMLLIPFPDDALRWGVDFLYRRGVGACERAVVAFMDANAWGGAGDSEGPFSDAPVLSASHVSAG